MCLIHDVVEIDAGDTYTYDAEAKFAHALDNFQPLMLNHSNGGEDWKAHNVTAAQVYGRHNSTKYGSETLFEITEQIIQENIKKGTIKPVRFYKTGGYNRKFKDVKKHE